VHHDIAQLDVPVQNPLLVKRMEGFSYLEKEPLDQVWILKLSLASKLAHGGARDILHGNPWGLLVEASIENLYQIGMAYQGKQPSLPTHPLQVPLLTTCMHELEGAWLSGARHDASKDGSHAAATEQLIELESLAKFLRGTTFLLALRHGDGQLLSGSSQYPSPPLATREGATNSGDST
jgi:hypothetical protein